MHGPLNPGIAAYRVSISCVGERQADNVFRKFYIGYQTSTPGAPAPKVSWKINDQVVSGTVYEQTSDRFTFAYTSTYADNCNLKAEKSTNGSSFTPWYEYLNLGTSYNWGNQLQQMTASWYRWTATCHGSGGTTAKALIMKVTAPAITICSDTMPMYSLVQSISTIPI
jgi:hypothetical protein